MLSLSTNSSAPARFLFIRIDNDNEQVEVFFSEPVSHKKSSIEDIKERVNLLKMVGPDNEEPLVINLEKAEELGVIYGTLPKDLENTPYFLTGFLDYGEFGYDNALVTDLQYTFSVQISSTNPSDDFSHFFHGVVGTDAKSLYIRDNVDPFMIALKNYGPPYHVVIRGVLASTPVRVCIYKSDSVQIIGCVEGIHDSTHRLTFDSEVLGVLKSCRTYYALGNTTIMDGESGRTKNLWSSTSVVWNGPCRNSRSRTPVPQWYKPSNFDVECSHSSTGKNALGLLVPSIFLSGFLGGMTFLHLVMRRRRGRNENGMFTHHKFDSTNDIAAMFEDDISLVDIVDLN